MGVGVGVGEAAGVGGGGEEKLFCLAGVRMYVDNVERVANNALQIVMESRSDDSQCSKGRGAVVALCFLSRVK